MYIKKILEYNYNYANYMVSDGNKEVKCLCLSVPLPNDREPQVGMEVLKIYAFTVNKLEIMKVLKEKDKNFYISKTPLIGFDYKIKARIVDCKKAVVEVFNFTISLEFEYENGFSEDFKNGDFIEFEVDRLDCKII